MVAATLKYMSDAIFDRYYETDCLFVMDRVGCSTREDLWYCDKKNSVCMTSLGGTSICDTADEVSVQSQESILD